jgi:cytochrome c-type biogenesis protein CcmH
MTFATLRAGHLKMGFLCLLLCFSSAAHAVQPDEMLKDPVLESRARELSAGFRCMVCQNQSIDESDAPLARDLRILIRERLQAGDSNQQVSDFVFARYGDYVLLKPRLTPETLALWAVPFLIVMGGLVLFVRRRPPRMTSTESPLSAEEKERLRNLG